MLNDKPLVDSQGRILVATDRLNKNNNSSNQEKEFSFSPSHSRTVLASKLETSLLDSSFHTSGDMSRSIGKMLLPSSYYSVFYHFYFPSNFNQTTKNKIILLLFLRRKIPPRTLRLILPQHKFQGIVLVRIYSVTTNLMI